MSFTLADDRNGMHRSVARGEGAEGFKPHALKPFFEAGRFRGIVSAKPVTA